VLETTTNLTVK